MTHSLFIFEGAYKNHFEQERQSALHYHSVTHGDKAGSEIFTIHHTSLLLQGMMQRWKKPRKKRETSPRRNKPTRDITKNEFQQGGDGRKDLQDNEEQQRKGSLWNHEEAKVVLYMEQFTHKEHIDDDKKRNEDIKWDRLRNEQEKEH